MRFKRGIHWKSQTALLSELSMISTFRNILGQIFSGYGPVPIGTAIADQTQPLQAIGITDFLSINVPAREMLLSPILPERSLAMLYAPRGIGKSCVKRHPELPPLRHGELPPFGFTVEG